MPCGDLVYHECFDQERERIFLENNIPTLSWGETRIIRGIDPSSFVFTRENGVVWRGMMATYPTPVSGQLVEASRLAMNRMAIFRGDSFNGSINWGPAAVKLSLYRQRWRKFAAFLFLFCLDESYSSNSSSQLKIYFCL